MFIGRKLIGFAVFIGMFFWQIAVFSSAAYGSTDEYPRAQVPAWVEATVPFDPQLLPVAEASYGFRSRINEFQFNGIEPGNSSYYQAIEYELSNQYGVENYSSIDLSFDPSYEQLKLHELIIKRGDTLIDKFPGARFDLLRTESERAELIYDGTRTLAIVLDDVRAGDVIRYAYTIEGENPIYQGHREFRVNTELWNAVDRQYTRILTSSDKPLNRRMRGADVPLLVNEENGITEIIIDQRGIAEFDREDDVPSWHFDRGTIVFSDMADWRSVVDWMLPMYALPEASVPEVITIASVIKTSHEAPDAQIGAALRWVQEEVRYFGVELGKNSHWPSRPEETLQRRFGDCKDKALLLIAVLRELGVEASPALVNTNRGLEASNYPFRMHAFNHVIVHVLQNGESHFIDPTRRNQSGALGDMHEPDYGRALILLPDTSGLTEMGNSRSKHKLTIAKQLAIPRLIEGSEAASVAMFTVNTEKRGRLAESVRHSLETTGKQGIADDFLDYYKDYFETVSVDKEIEIVDSAENTMLITEQYRINDIWMSDENVKRYRWLHADEIMSYLDHPEQIRNRRQPYELIHPVAIEESWTVSMSEPLITDELDEQFSNAWLSFSKQSTVSDDGSQLTVTFRYSTLANEVAAEELQEYAESVKEIEDMASFYLEHQPPTLSVRTIASNLAKAGAVHYWFLLLGVIVLVNRYRGSTRQQDHATG